WPMSEVPRVPGNAETRRRVWKADRELAQAELAHQHCARPPKLAYRRRVGALAPPGFEHSAVGGSRRVGRGDDVLEPERNTVQRTSIRASCQLGVSSLGC